MSGHSYIGNTKIKHVYYGTTKIKKIYSGTRQVWSGASVVTYHVDSGVTETREVDEGLSVLTYTPTKSGWTFLGWRDDSTASGSVHTTKVATGEPMTLYAVFYQNITVTYYNNSTTASTSTKQRYYNNGNIANPSFALTEASVSGWSARGWSTSNTGNASITYGNGATFTRDSNITLYSLYSRTVTVSYNGNGQTEGSTSASTGTAYRNASGTVINASIALKGNGFSKSGWAFKCWGTSSSADSGITTYTGYADTTVYAIWKQSSTIKSQCPSANGWVYSQSSGDSGTGWTGEGEVGTTYEYHILRVYKGGSGSYPCGNFEHLFDRKHCDTLSFNIFTTNVSGSITFGSASVTFPANFKGIKTLNLSGQPQVSKITIRHNREVDNNTNMTFYPTLSSFS